MLTKEGRIDWQAEYDPWGARLNYIKPDTIYQPIRLQGQHYDIESGLYYNRHRFYDPKIGRYISQDPIGLKGGSNLYAYPMNPNQAVDPMGLFAYLVPFVPYVTPAILEGIAWGAGVLGIGILGAAVIDNRSSSDVDSSDEQNTNSQSRSIPYPQKIRGMWSCIGRADCNDNFPGNCSEIPSLRFSLGEGYGKTQIDARSNARVQATKNLGSQPKHVSCKCTGPKGEKYSGGC